MKVFEQILKENNEFKKILSCIKLGIRPISITGVSTIHKSSIIHSVCKENLKKALIITADELEAQTMCKDLCGMGTKAIFFPYRDFCFRNVEGKSKEYELKRISVLKSIVDGDFDAVITCCDAALQSVIPKFKLKESIFKLKSSMEISTSQLTEKLLRCGYERSEQVEGIGQFSVRGGIFDIFPPKSPSPIRLEFFGDEIDTMSYFNIETQRRTNVISSFEVTPASEVLVSDKDRLIRDVRYLAEKLKNKNEKLSSNLILDAEKLSSNVNISNLDKYINLIYEDNSCIFDYFSSENLIFVSEQVKIKEHLKSYFIQFTEDIKIYLEEGIICKELGDYSKDTEYFKNELLSRQVLCMDTFASNNYIVVPKDILNISAYAIPVWRGELSNLYDDVRSFLDSEKGCLILSGTEKFAKSVCYNLQDKGINARLSLDCDKVMPGEVVVSSGGLSSGFRFEDSKIVVISHGQGVSGSKKRSVKKASKGISNLSELKKGSYVVHATHGIGMFMGIHRLSMNGVTKDYIKLSYDKGDTLYVPVTQMDMVSKYVGTKDDVRVKLNKLGGSDWQKTKKRVKSAVKDIAKNLIKLYSERMKAEGYAFSEDNEWQKDFESSFEYVETEDQIRSINEIKSDMQRKAPMDRLLCGDVGFGKTEVALRAAFKCVTDGKQCAMLVPTTILAWQHFQTAIKRFENFPIRVELLSRFRTSKQQEEILRRLSKGEIDFIIGTHRLVQKDVKFRDLGLVIIDEEQRFGVAHKEKFKEMSKNVDVLTLSATPIPRTLNMAMSGIRDMSTLEEAPQDRQPVQTYVMEFDKGVIFDSIRREIHRGGQIYYLHNNIETIQQTATSIGMQIPEANVGIAHGRMSENELSEVWRKMLEHEINVLVCTTIIETGVDIPNANTLIIENADCMGLSQLHQLRGRVGRSSRRAYAYFTFRQNKSLSEISQKRLSAIRDFTEFGSGFKIAMRDLELRGAGNIIGAEQHGNMADVGYDMYLKLLDEAVKEEKGESVSEQNSECLVDIQVDANIPESYIKSLGQRLDAYRRISDIKCDEDASDVIDEFIDRYGDIPKAVRGLINIALIRNVARLFGIYEIKQNNNYILLYQSKLEINKDSEIIKRMNGKITVNAGNKPYMSIKCNTNDKPLEILMKAFNLRKI